MPVLHIRIQGELAYMVVSFRENVEVCFKGVISFVLVARRNICTLLRPLNIVIMRPTVLVIGPAK